MTCPRLGDGLHSRPPAPAVTCSCPEERRRARPQRKGKGLPAQLAAVNLPAAGIDIGAPEPWGAVPPDSNSQPGRRFGACTADLQAVAVWRQPCGVTTGALESTGGYWLPLGAWLETRGFSVVLAEAREGPRAPGRPKTDGQDCQWRQRLHTYGLLAAAFRPPEQICGLRSYLRPRALLVTSASPHSQHRQKALTQMKLKLQPVVSDVTRVTGLAILKAILTGAREPLKLAQLRARPCQQSEAEIARALQGKWRAEPLLTLQPAVER